MNNSTIKYLECQDISPIISAVNAKEAFLAIHLTRFKEATAGRVPSSRPNPTAAMQNTEKKDIYSLITNQIVSHLEKGVRPWVRPWNAEHAAGRFAGSSTRAAGNWPTGAAI